jgi:hypothetical protein
MIKENLFNEPIDLDIKSKKNKNIYLSVINHNSNFSDFEVINNL